MNSVERFNATVKRQQVDRPACWLGMPTSAAIPGLCNYFGVSSLEELKTACGDDIHGIEVPYKSPTCSAMYAAFDWYMSGTDVDPEHRTLTAKGFFADFETVEEAEKAGFPWPDPALYIDPAACKQLADEAPKDKALLGIAWACHFQDFCAAFGMENAMLKMLEAPELIHYVDDHVVEFYLKALKIFLDATGEKLSAILIGDDMGSQLDLMISLDHVKEFILPGAKKLIDLIHSYGVKVIYHSCGAISRAIPTLIEAGVDVIHPIQAVAAGMDSETLHEKFSDKVSFCGGVDTQMLLPNGTEEQVMTEVKHLRTLFPTGLVISPSHEAILPDVPPVNIKAMFTEAQKLY
jgi:uroporphyrinogen decarboxylase